MKLNQVFDNEHRRDGERSMTEIHRLARDIIESDTSVYSRNEQDLAALVSELNFHYALATRRALVYRDLLRTMARRSSYWREMLFTTVTPAHRRLFIQGAPRVPRPTD